MSRRAVQRVAGNLRRGFGWRHWAIAPIGLLVLACAGTLLQSRKSQPDQQNYQSPDLAVGNQADRLNFIPGSGSRVELQGKATIGSWRSLSTEIHGEVVLDIDATALNTFFDRIQSDIPYDESRVQPHLPTLSFRSPSIGDISVPVMSLHGDSGGMDRDMQNALNVTRDPSIEFVFQQAQQIALQRDSHDHQIDLKLRILGKLNMAGVGQLVVMDVLVKRDSRRHFLAHAQTGLFMTDFGMTPPGALFGLIKADDQVFVIFDLDLVLAAHSPIR